MGRRIMDLGTAAAAAILVMIIHELSKSIVYYLRNREESKGSIRSMLRFYECIDPIGLICCVAGYGGFSKPYFYRMKDKKLNRWLGITGFMSLITMALLTVAALRYQFGVRFMDGGLYYNAAMSAGNRWMMQICFNIAFCSIGMFVVNLFPIATFDMGNLVAGVSVAKFFEYLKKDFLLKMIVLLVIILGIPAAISQSIVCILL